MNEKITWAVVRVESDQWSKYTIHLPQESPIPPNAPSSNKTKKKFLPTKFEIEKQYTTIMFYLCSFPGWSSVEYLGNQNVYFYYYIRQNWKWKQN